MITISSLINIAKHEISARLIKSKGLTEFEKINKELENDGCSIIYNFLSKNECDNLIEIGRRLINEKSDCVALESNNSDARIYGVDLIANDFGLRGKTDRIDEWAKRFYKTDEIKSFQMLGNIKYNEENLGSGGGWHRDSPFSHQFKFIIYLNDVNKYNGPFQYIKGTHKERELYRYSKLINAPLDRYRFNNEEILEIENEIYKDKVATIEGLAGTLLLADVKGLHRGKPLISGERWATTRYYYKKQIPDQFSKK
jgi:hypothetical protein